MFYIITWKEFVSRKMIDMAEIVKGDKGMLLLNQMKTMNSQKRLTTTDYRVYNISEMLKRKSLEITEKVNTE